MSFIINPYRFATSASDPYWSSVILLLHCDGTDGSTTITDSSSAARTVTAYNGAALSTGTKKFGTASLQTDGSNDYADTSGSTDFNFSTNVDVTIEFWLWADSTDSSGCGLTQTAGGGGPWYVVIQLGAVYIGNGAVNLITYSYAGYYNQWVHVAFTRSGTTPRLFLNGNLVATGSNAALGSSGTNGVRLMYYAANNFYGKGYIDDVRITRGVARYTANFTPPTAAFPDS